MSFMFPQAFLAPAGCAGSRCSPRQWQHSRSAPFSVNVHPLWDFIDESINESLKESQQHVSKRARRSLTTRFDVSESHDAYKIEGEVPGVQQKDITIEFPNDSTIQIKGHRGTQQPTSSQNPEENDNASPCPATVASGAQQEKPATETATAATKPNQATVEDEKAAPATEEWVDVPASEKRVQTTNVVEGQADANAATSEKKNETQEQTFQVRERSYGSFSRSFKFSNRVNVDAVSASLNNGVLQINIPKAAVPAIKRINIE